MILILVLILDFIISVWDCYATGFNAAILSGGKNFGRKTSFLLGFFNTAGLLVGFAGATYVVMIVLGFIAYYAGYISFGSIEFILAFNFLVFGGLITIFGIIVTINSIIIAYKMPSWGSVGTALWNTFASIWDSVLYLRNFGEMFGFVKENEDNAKGMVLVIIGIAIAIGVVIAYAAYHMGYRRAGPSFT